jgi:hypothetical protein
MSPTFLTFLAGIASSGAVAIIIDVLTAPKESAGFVAASIPWFALSTVLFSLGVETGRRDEDLGLARRIAANDAEERRATDSVRAEHFRALVMLRIAVGVAAASSVSAVLLLAQILVATQAAG